MKIQLAKGECSQCPAGMDLVYGIPYEKAVITSQEEEIVRVLYSSFMNYRIARRPLDAILVPQEELIIPSLENTCTHPEIAVVKNGDAFPSWIAEFVDEESFEVSMMLKPIIYKDAGVLEYWVVDTAQKTLYVFDLTQTSFLPRSYTIPQRIAVGIYKDFLISYSSIFKKR